MALWNKVLSGFNADDETVNFGARTVAENNGSIFETRTLATIQSEGQVLSDPNVSASIQYSMFCVAVDKSITIFSDETCYRIILSIGFDSLITTYCMSKDGSIVLIALASGILHCLHVPSGGKQVFDENIAEKFGDRIVKVFLQEEDQRTDIIIVAASGVIYGIDSFDTKLVHSALIDEDDCRLMDIVKKIKCVKIYKGSETRQAASVGFLSSQSSIVTIGKNIHLWPSNRLCGHWDSLPFKYTKVQFFKKEGAMIFLRDDGILSIVCLETLMGRKILGGSVADFVTVQDETNDFLLILTVPEKGAATTFLKLVSFPDFDCKLEISVATTTYLVDLVGCSVENIVFLEGIKNSSRKIEMIRVIEIVENKPEYRLERLLRRGQFEEAEFFAKQFKLNLDSVNAAKAAAFINQLGPWTNETNDPEKFENFISTLDKINDVKYIYDCCNNALTSNYEQTRRLVSYACERITRDIRESNSHDLASLLSTLNGNLRKLETFEFIRKTKIGVERGDTRDVQEWIKFSRANLLQECIERLSLGELEAAAAIWIRHLPEFAPVITPTKIHDILNSISETIVPCKLWPWLNHFVPSVISFLPNALSEIILWAYKKTRSLEKYHRKGWPQIGLDFSRRLIDLLSFQESNICFNLNQLYTSKSSHLHRLMTLVQAMTDLLELKTLHRIVLPLETYLDDPTNVTHFLLNKAHVEAIPSLIETFLRQYMLNNSLQNDKVLSSYVQKTLRNSKSWWFWEKAPWEERVSIVIEHIHDVENRLQQTVDVLKKAPVPWSDTIVTLAEVSYNFDHPLVSKIRTESSGVAVKLILKKYGYAHVGLCTKLFRYIIKQDRKDMIADICELTRADNSMRTKAFCFCTNHHLSIGNIDRAMEVLRHVDDDIGQYCCEQIVNVTIGALRFKKRDDWLAYYIEALGPVEVKLRQIISRRSESIVEFNDSLKNIPNLKRIYKLEKQFNVWITHENYHTGKKQVLESYIDRLVFDVENEKKSLLECCESLERVSNLLDLSPLASILKFYDRTKDIIILKRSINRMAQSGISLRDESFHLNQFCTAWVESADRDPEISMLLIKLAISSIVNCNSGPLSDAVLCHNRMTAYSIVDDSEGTYKPESEQRIMNLNDQGYTLYTIYKDAAVSSGNMLLPLFKDSLKITNFYAARQISKDGRVDDSGNEEEIKLLVRSLMERAKKIENEHHDYLLLEITKNLHYRSSALLSIDPAVMTETRALLSYCLYTLLRKVVGARSLDVFLGLACLFMLTEQEATKWIKAAARSFQGDPVRHREVVILGCEYFRITKLHAQLCDFDRQKLLHRWGRRLTEYGISYKEMFASDLVQKRDILERVMHCRESNLIELLEEFCGDFGFDENDCFLLYLQVLFDDWRPQLNFTTANGRKELKINESDVRDLNSRCKQVAVKIKDKALMKRHLTQLSPQINFYHYEVFLAMLELMGVRNVERIQHFCFLQNYTRYGRPTELEREAWASLCHDGGSLPPISQWRLPFLPKIDQFKLITPELNLKTYEKWLSIAPILKIQSHVICTLAIKGSITETWENYINDENRCQVWSLYPLNSGLLSDIKKCIKCMGGPESLYYGTAALYFVVNHTPQGADQVAAAQECFASAQLWEQQSNKSDGAHEAMIVKIKDKYLRLTSKHILHTHGVGDDKYLNLIGHPENLIRELYNDESIPERWRGPVQHRPDINSAANALGSIFSINMTTLRYNFLLEWLQSEPWQGNESMTMGFGNTMGNTEDNPIEEDNLMRACYILESGDPELHAKLLMSIGFEGEKEDGAGIRFRALRVLESVVDDNTLQDRTKRDPTNFRRYMKSLRYLSELERLGLAYSVSSFESCSKHKLAQILLKTQYYTPRALSLILQICIDYDIHDYSLLNATLEEMVKQSMAKELEKFLPVVGTISHAINCSGYISGWQVVVADPFEKLDAQPTPKQIADCIGSLRLLHACPVVSKLEFKDTVNRCIHRRQPHLAAALLPFLSDKDRNSVLEEIKINFNVSQVIDDLIGLTPKGILVVPQSLVLLRTISVTETT